MKKKVIYSSIFLLLFCLQGVALADYYSRQFGDMDLSRDDAVNFKEYRYYVSGATAEDFKKIDTSKDEKIDFFEWVEFQEKDYPFESRRGFEYKGKSGTWYLDRHGNRYKDRGGYYYGYGYDCWPDYWYDYRRRHHYGTYGDHYHCPPRSRWAIGFGISTTH